jgi:hypothetical protein
MHLHNRPHFKLQDDDVTCSLHSAGDDLEQLLVSIDVNDLRKLILSTTACSATFVTPGPCDRGNENEDQTVQICCL